MFEFGLEKTASARIEKAPLSKSFTVKEIHLAAASIYVIFQYAFKPKPYKTHQAKVVHCIVD